MHTSKAACKLSIGVQGHEVDLSGVLALVQLYELELNIGRSSYPSLEPIYVIQSLKFLNLAGAGSVHVTTGLSNFCKLAVLVITGFTTHAGTRVHATLAMQWSHMPALQFLHVRNVDFSTDDMTVLTSCNSLNVADFSSGQPSDLVSMKHFAELIYCLGSKRSDITCKC